VEMNVKHAYPSKQPDDTGPTTSPCSCASAAANSELIPAPKPTAPNHSLGTTRKRHIRVSGGIGVSPWAPWGQANITRHVVNHRSLLKLNVFR